MAPRTLNQRLAHVEARAIEQTATVLAARIGQAVGADPDVLLGRAVEIAEQIERFGYARTIELVAHGVGLTAEQLETRTRQLSNLSG